MAGVKTFGNPKELYRALNQLPKDAQNELRTASKAIAGKIADEASTNASQEGGVAALVSPYIKAYRDRVPTVKMGSERKLPPRNGKARKGDRQSVSDIIWGAEFGGGSRPRTRQFKPWRGNSTGAGYFLWPAVRELGDQIREEYSRALLDAMESI